MIKNLRILTIAVAAMIVIDTLLKPAILAWASIDRDSLLSAAGPRGTGIDFALIGWLILTMIVFSVWIYVAGRNLEAADLDLEYTAGSRIWWFAVPFANLVKPYQGMRELWNASHGAEHYDDTVPMVTLWWAAWLGGNLFTYFMSKVSGPEAGTGPLWIETVIDLAQAAVAIPMIVAIARAQRRTLSGDQLQDVFA
jgi:hypothetical protein